MKKITILLVMALIVSLTVSSFAYELPFDASDVDFGGETVTYVGFWDPREPYVEGGDRAGRLEEAMEKFNIGKIEYIGLAWGDPLKEGMMNRLMNEESNYDIWCLPSNQAMAMLKNGAFYPVNEIMPQSFYDSLLPDWKAITETFSLGGDKYSIGGSGASQTIEYIVWNKDLFERSGLPALDEIYKNGEWTWSKFEEIAVQATRDTNGDGEVDQWGVSDMNPMTWMFTNNARVVKQNQDGVYQFAFNNEAAYTFLNKFKEWTQEMNIKQGNWQHKEFKAGQVAMASMPLWMINDELIATAEFEFSLVPLPKGPNVDDYVFPAVSADSFYLPLNAENPKGLIALHSFLNRPEEEATAREEIIIEVAPDRTSYEVLNRGLAEWDGEIYALESILGPWWDTNKVLGEAMGKVLYEGQSPASAMEAVEPRIQQLLDSTFNE